MLGLLWIVQLFVGDTAGENPVETMRWENLFFIVKACVPDHKNEGLKEDLKHTTEGVWGEMGVYIFSQWSMAWKTRTSETRRPSCTGNQ